MGINEIVQKMQSQINEMTKEYKYSFVDNVEEEVTNLNEIGTKCAKEAIENRSIQVDATMLKEIHLDNEDLMDLLPFLPFIYPELDGKGYTIICAKKTIGKIYFHGRPELPKEKSSTIYVGFSATIEYEEPMKTLSVDINKGVINE